MSVAEERRTKKVLLGEDNNSLVMLFAINSLVFVVLKFTKVVYQMTELPTDAFYRNIFNWFVLPAEIGKLSGRPWTLLSYMFTHDNLMHILPNMLWLWAFGYVLQDLTGNKKLIPVYIYGGLVGAVVYITAYYLIPRLQPGLETASFLGANASVMAIAIATTTVSPDYRLFPMINGGIPLWIMTTAFVIVDIATIDNQDPALYLAHIAGGGLGFLFIYQMRKGNDWSIWMNNFFDWVNNLFNPNKKEIERRAKDEFFYKVHGANPYKRIPNVTEKRINEILDKINENGYHFLTDEEKDILRRASTDENPDEK
ncbi:MAG: rhomboid family intramembrane serine protease [Gemmatimonadaceae bacterium]|nr:rhomboid family intramembrane serine protease [Chitinophagaceae bacterium]